MTVAEQIADIAREFARLKASADWIAANRMLETTRAAAVAVAEVQSKLPDLADIQKLVGTYRPVELNALFRTFESVPPPSLRLSAFRFQPSPKRRSIVRREVKRRPGFAPF